MTAPRLLTIAYAGLSLPATGYQITGVHVLEKDYERFRVEFDVVVQAATEAALLALTAPLEAAFRKPDQDTSIVVNGSSFLAVTHSGNTGFSARASLRLLPVFRSALSRAYRCRVDGRLPADLSGRSGRLDSTVRLRTDAAGLRTLFVSAIYTALSSNSATAQITAAFATYTAGLKTAFGGGATWTTTAELEVESDDQDKVATATVAYRQQILDEGPTADEATYELLALTVDSERPQSRGLARAGVGAPFILQVNFVVAVLAASTTDLKDVYESTVRAYVVSLATRASLDGSVSPPQVISDRTQFDARNNRIAGAVTLLVQSSSVLEADKQVITEEQLGVALVPVFGEDPHEKDLHTGPAHREQTVMIRTLELAGGEQFGSLVSAAQGEAEAASYVLVQTRDAKADLEISGPVQSDELVRMVERAAVLRFVYRSRQRAGTGGAGRQRVVTQPTANVRGQPGFVG